MTRGLQTNIKRVLNSVQKMQHEIRRNKKKVEIADYYTDARLMQPWVIEVWHRLGGRSQESEVRLYTWLAENGLSFSYR